MSSKSPESEELIDNFIDELWLERGLSKNTLSAYRQDISSFNKWLNTTHLLEVTKICLLYTSPSPRDRQKSRMPSSA